MEEKAKRERSANFNIEERDILVTQVIKYQHILENKQSDATTWKQKEHAWQNIEREFNARSGGTYRSAKTLRIKFEGLKRSIRKKSAALRAELYKTGGGTSSAPPLDPIEEKVKGMISLSSDGMESIFDSDVIPQPPTQTLESHDGLNISIEEFLLIPPYTIDIDSDATPKNTTTPDGLAKFENQTEVAIDLSQSLLKKVDDKDMESEVDKYVPTPSKPSFKKWDVTSRRNLKSRKHPALIASNSQRKPFDVLAEAKLELVQLQKSLLEAEIKEKQKEWDFKEKERKWREEEYKLKIRKLEKELNE